MVTQWQLPDRWTAMEAARLAHLLEYRACVLVTALRAAKVAHPAEELELLTMQDGVARLRRAVAVEGRKPRQS